MGAKYLSLILTDEISLWKLVQTVRLSSIIFHSRKVLEASNDVGKTVGPETFDILYS